MTIEAFETWFASHLAERYRPVAGALLSYAIVPVQTGATGPLDGLACCRCMFFDEGRAARDAQDYGPVLLAEEWLPAGSCVADLSALLRGQRRLSGRTLAPREPGQDQFNTRKWNSESGWPEHRFDARLAGQNFHLSIPHDTIAKKGLRPWSSGALAIVKWVWGHGRSYSGGEIPNKAEIVVIVPDTRTRIVSADWKGSRATVAVEANVPLADLELQRVFRHARPEEGEPEVELRVPEPTMIFDVPDWCSAIELYMLHGAADLLGEVVLNQRGDEFDAAAVAVTVEKQAEQDLGSSESQSIEFKPFVAPADEKEGELLETIIAFSNATGGTLYIGAKDDGTPLGGSALRKAASASLERANDMLIARLEKIVRENIKPVPKIECLGIEVFASPIIVVKVPRGSDGPYSTQDNNIWVRKGSTNKRPDPKTELPYLFPAPSTGNDPFSPLAGLARFHVHG